MSHYYQNKWIGNQEYVINFCNGQYRVVEVNVYDYDLDLSSEIYVGTLEACKQHLDDLEVNYLESLY